MAFEFKITQISTNLKGPKSIDCLPFVSKDERFVCSAYTAVDIEKKVRDFLSQIEGGAMVTDVFEDGSGDYEIEISVKNGTIYGVISNDDLWQSYERRRILSLKG